MASRLKLQENLEKLLGSRNVYYQPPSTVEMTYPAIKYSKSQIKGAYANDTAYILTNGYEIIVIDPQPDNPVICKILSLPNSRFERHYKSNNLNHDVITLYY